MEPDDSNNSRKAPPKALSQRAHRQLIGYLGFFLPALLYIVAGLRPTKGLTSWDLLDSVCSYYYTGAVAIFVGILFALALFLLTYQGYKGVVVDRVIGRIGGCAALGVALFPTSAPKELPEPSWWASWVLAVHYTSAVVLFASFITFAIWLFRKSGEPRREDRSPGKKRRDRIYLTCGIVMIICMLWAVISILKKAPIFWPESIAVVAFAVSWLVKGEAESTVRKALGTFVTRARSNVRQG